MFSCKNNSSNGRSQSKFGIVPAVEMVLDVIICNNIEEKNVTCKAVTIQPKVVKLSQLCNGVWNGAYECDK